MTRLRSLSLLLLAAVTGCGGGEPPADSPTEEPSGAAPSIAAPETDIWLATLHVGEAGLSLADARNVTARTGYDNQPFFLSDGSFLYTREADGSTDIWRYEPGSGSHSQVTDTPESEYSPTPIPGVDGFSVVRVESDGTQRLWEFDMGGGNATVIFPDIAPVGYHAWIDGENAFLFILGEPPTLHAARRGVAGSTLLAEGIGPSIQKVPGQPSVSFVEVTEVGTEIETWTLDGVLSRPVAEGVDGAAHHAWTPDGTLLQASGNAVFAFSSDGMGWMQIGTLPEGYQITRLAVSQDGGRLAMVAGPPAGG